MTPRQARDRLPALADRFVDLIDRTELSSPVPACAGWTGRDLIVHLGNVHRWVVQAITAGETAEPEPAVIPDGALDTWYRGVADQMLALFARTSPETPCWTFGMEPHRAAFWFRRQAHEIAVHLWDLGSVSGRDVGYDPALALDGIDEVATLFFPRQVRMGRIAPLTVTLALTPDDGPQRWVLAGDGTDPAQRDQPRPDAEVAGPAAALVLLLWGRLDLSDHRIRVSGSGAAATQVLGTALVP